MDVNTLLYISLLIYTVVMLLGFLFNIKWLYMVAGLLWFIPITQIDNLFIVLISSVMILVHGMLGFYEKKESEF